MPVRTSIAYLVQEFDLSCRVSVHVRHAAEEFSPHSNSDKFEHKRFPADCVELNAF